MFSTVNRPSSNLFMQSDRERLDLRNDFLSQPSFLQTAANPEEPRNPKEEKLKSSQNNVSQFAELTLKIKNEEKELKRIEAQLKFEREQLRHLQEN